MRDAGHVELAPAAHWQEAGCEHFAQFYEDDSVMLEAAAEFLAASLNHAGAALAVATQTHLAELERRLCAHGIDLADALSSGRYQTVDAEALLAQVLQGAVQKRQIIEKLEPAIEDACARYPRLHVFGELAALLCAQGRHQLAVDLEQSGVDRPGCSVMCAYPMSEFRDRAYAPAMLAACNAHHRVIPAESYSALRTEAERLLAIVQLQQKTSALEQEVRARKTLERALREEAHTLETLNRVGAVVAAELDLERVLQVVTDAATELSCAAFGAFFYNSKTADGESLWLYTLSGAPREVFSGFPMPRNTEVFAPTFSAGQVLRSDDITQDPRYGKNQPHRGMPEGHLPVRSYLAVPVTGRSGDVIGGLFLGHPEVAVFNERAERLVVGIAGQAAVAIDNARLYQAARAAPLSPR